MPYGGSLTVTASKPGYQSKTLTRREVTEDTVLDFGTLEPIVEEVTGLGRDQIRQVQACLQGAEYNPGPMDGLLGGRTRQAVRQWQAAQGLPVTGQLDAATLAALARLPMPSVTITLRADTPGVTFSPGQEFTARLGERVRVSASKQGYVTKSRIITAGERDMVVDLGRFEPGEFKWANRPVDTVSWDEVQKSIRQQRRPRVSSSEDGSVPGRCYAFTLCGVFGPGG